jgi:DHA1 family tetracycline resistance protein-like MFS transporter
MKPSSLFRGESAFLKGNFLVLTLSWIVLYFAQPIPATYASLYYLSLGANAFLLSVIGFAGSIAVALVQFPGGYLADKHGRRWLIVVMTYILALCTFFFILAPSWQIIVLGMMVQNLCLIYQPALIAMVIDSLPAKNRGAGYAFQSIVSSLVTLPGPLIAQFLILTLNFDMGMRVAYVIVLVTYLVAATLRLKLKETLVSNSSGSRPKIMVALKEYPKSVREGLNVWRKVPKSAFYLFLSSMGINGVVVSCQTYFVVYATSVLKITEAQWAIVMVFMYLSIAVPILLAGLRMDVVGRKRYLILGYLLYVPGMVLFVTADFYLALLAFFFYGLGNMLQMNSYQILLGDLIPRGLRGTVSGCMQFFMYLAQAFLQILIGFLYAFVSPQLPFLLLAVVAVPLALLIVYKVSEPSVKED